MKLSAAEARSLSQESTATIDRIVDEILNEVRRVATEQGATSLRLDSESKATAANDFFDFSGNLIGPMTYSQTRVKNILTLFGYVCDIVQTVTRVDSEYDDGTTEALIEYVFEISW